MKILKFISASLIILTSISITNFRTRGAIIPTPGGGYNDKEDSIQILREKYWSLIHKAAPGVVWQKIEDDNKKQNIALQNQRKVLLRNGRLQSEVFANGKLSGIWIETGSNNLAGRLLDMEFDKEQNAIYGISASGDFWKGNADGTGWQVLNDRNLLDGTALVLSKTSTGTRRFIASQYSGNFYETRKLYYSNDDGISWSPSIYDHEPSGLNDKILKIDDNRQTIFYSTGWQLNNNLSGPEQIYMSNDGGVNFKKLNLPSEFISGQTYCALAKAPGAKVLFLFNANKALYTIDADGTFKKIGVISNLPASNLAQPNSFLSRGYEFRISKNMNGLVYYALIDHQNLYRSTNGLDWQFVSTTPSNANGYFVFNVAPYNPDWLSYGDVELHYSTDAGNTWAKSNNWGDYYKDPNNLHADIQSFKYFMKTDGTPIQFSSSDGGIYVSTDNFKTNTNISLRNLNISQYYDLATDPVDPSIIWGTSQDQGLQRTTTANSSNTSDFVQLISGDYTSAAYTSDGTGVLSQYPGGSLIYADNVRASVSLSPFFLIKGLDKGNAGWHLPISPISNATDKAFWVGGGNMNGTNGSFLIRLARNTSFSGFAYKQLSFDFKQNASNISALSVSPVDTNQIYVACEDGSFFYSSDAGQTFNRTLTFNGPPPPYITPSAILTSKKNKNLVCFGGSGYSNDPFYDSTDGGKSFKAAADGLHPTTIFDLAFNDNEDMVFAATQAGPYVYIVPENKWYSLLGAYAPLSANYTCVEYVSALNTVRFGTYGRGIWDLRLDADASLPVTLIDFKARLSEDKKSIFLKWTTAREFNSMEFQVEQSENTSSWQQIGYVKASGSSSVNTQYSFTDDHPLPGTDFYRLKMVDLNQTSVYSKVVSVKLPEDAVRYHLFPNPANGFTWLSTTSRYNKKVEVSVYSSGGKLISIQMLELSNTAPAKLNFNDLQPGLYMIKIKDGQNSIIEKIVLSAHN